MKKRYRKYYCKHCKQTLVMMSDKQWIESYCDRTGVMARVRLILVKKNNNKKS